MQSPPILKPDVFSHPSAFWRPASVMWNRRRIADRANLDAGSLQRPYCRVAPRPRALDIHFKRPHPDFARAIGRRHRSLLGRERGSLARSFEAQRTGAGPAHDISLEIGNGDDRIVERRLNVGDSTRNNLLFFFLSDFFLGLRHQNSYLLCLCRGLFLHGHGAAARTLARAAVGLGALSTHGQTSPVTEAAVRSNFHEPLDVHGDFLAEVTFNAILLFDHFSNLVDLVVVQFTNLDVETDAGRGKDFPGL